MANVDAVANSGRTQQFPELRIVLIGGRQLHENPSNKSAAGNIILRKSVFGTSRRTAQCDVGQHQVYDRQITVVDTPGWWWHYPLENTPKLDQLEIKNSIYMCAPGPHAFLLVIPLNSIFPQIFKLSLKEHLKLFHKNVINHTIVLFTACAPHSDKSLEHQISTWPALKRILERCGNRKHVLNINNTQDSTQVEMLFKKIEAMVAGNGGGYYSTDTAAGNALREKMEAIAERASERFAEVQTQRRKLQALIEGGKTPPPHLKLVMVGAQGSAKSSAGNTILGKQAFTVYHRRTTELCQIGHGMVAGKQITVTDSPGWLYNHTLHDTCEMDKLQIECSMYLCPPGPHAVLLVIGLASAFNASCQRAVQGHMSLFTDYIWEHTIALFTRGDWLGVKTVEERIESEKGLQWLVKKCGNRYHVLDNMKYYDELQVTELLEKTEEMWAGNKDPHYEVNLGHAEKIEARKEARDKKAKMIKQITERKLRIMKELFKGERKPNNGGNNIRVVLVGGKGSGKSMVGNRILFEELFDKSLMKKEFQRKSASAMCVKHKRYVAGVDITVVETPGWLTDTTVPTWLKDEVLRSASMCAPGPHVFLLVIAISKAFTEKDLKAIVDVLTPFGERVWRHCMVVFTWGDWLNNRSIEEHIAGEGKALHWLVEKCRNRYSILNYYCFGDGYPVTTLLPKMTDIITQNEGHCFTTEDKLEKKLKLLWRSKQPTLTEEEWKRREQELIDRMLKAVAQEPEEPTLPSVKMTGSLDGAFIPSMSGDTPLEYGLPFWRQSIHARVTEWVSLGAANSVATSGVDTMSASASFVEDLDENQLTENHHPLQCFSPGKDKITIHHTMVSTDSMKTQHAMCSSPQSAGQTAEQL